MRECRRCGTDLGPRPGGRPGPDPSYCPDCRVQVRREQRDATRKPHELLDLAPRPCTVCGAAFKPTRRAQKYCSRKCRLHGIYEARKADGRIQLAGPAVERHLTCVRCGSGFAQTGPGRPRRYCSKTCKTAI